MKSKDSHPVGESIDIVMAGDFDDGSRVKVKTIPPGKGKDELVATIMALDIPKTDVHIGSFKREAEEDYKFGEATKIVVPPSSETIVDGFKISDSFGSNGVICQVCDDADMPINLATGERAHVLVNDYSGFGLQLTNLYSGNNPPAYKPYSALCCFTLKQHNAEYEAKQNLN